MSSLSLESRVKGPREVERPKRISLGFRKHTMQHHIVSTESLFARFSVDMRILNRHVKSAAWLFYKARIIYGVCFALYWIKQSWIVAKASILKIDSYHDMQCSASNATLILPWVMIITYFQEGWHCDYPWQNQFRVLDRLYQVSHIWTARLDILCDGVGLPFWLILWRVINYSLFPI